MESSIAIINPGLRDLTCIERFISCKDLKEELLVHLRQSHSAQWIGLAFVNKFVNANIAVDYFRSTGLLRKRRWNERKLGPDLVVDSIHRFDELRLWRLSVNFQTPLFVAMVFAPNASLAAVEAQKAVDFLGSLPADGKSVVKVQLCFGCGSRQSRAFEPLFDILRTVSCQTLVIDRWRPMEGSTITSGSIFHEEVEVAAVAISNPLQILSASDVAFRGVTRLLLLRGLPVCRLTARWAIQNLIFNSSLRELSLENVLIPIEVWTEMMEMMTLPALREFKLVSEQEYGPLFRDILKFISRHAIFYLTVDVAGAGFASGFECGFEGLSIRGLRTLTCQPIPCLEILRVIENKGDISLLTILPDKRGGMVSKSYSSDLIRSLSGLNSFPSLETVGFVFIPNPTAIDELLSLEASMIAHGVQNINTVVMDIRKVPFRHDMDYGLGVAMLLVRRHCSVLHILMSVDLSIKNLFIPLLRNFRNLRRLTVTDHTRCDQWIILGALQVELDDVEVEVEALFD